MHRISILVSPGLWKLLGFWGVFVGLRELFHGLEGRRSDISSFSVFSRIWAHDLCLLDAWNWDLLNNTFLKKWQRPGERGDSFLRVTVTSEPSGIRERWGWDGWVMQDYVVSPGLNTVALGGLCLIHQKPRPLVPHSMPSPVLRTPYNFCQLSGIT